MSGMVHWLAQHQGACSWKKHFGVECPGCGMQRAFLELIQGNLAESISIYPALIPIMILLVFTTVHLIFNFRRGALIIKILFIFTTLIMFIHFIYKLVL